MFIKKADIVLIILLLIIALAFNFVFLKYVQKGGQVVISYNANVYKTLPLNEENTLEIKNPQGEILIKINIKNGEAYISEASCKDKYCLKQGHIKNTNQSIVCLPNKIMVEIKSGGDGDFDTVIK